MKQLLRGWLPPLMWMGLIFLLSAQPHPFEIEEQWLDLLLKKIGHTLEYGILAWLYLRGLRGRFHHTTRLRAASAGLAVIYALSDEYHQTFVPGRYGTLWDVAIDGIGACGAMLLDSWLQRRRSSPPQVTGAR
jgi:VanZ family protein